MTPHFRPHASLDRAERRAFRELVRNAPWLRPEDQALLEATAQLIVRTRSEPMDHRMARELLRYLRALRMTPASRAAPAERPPRPPLQLVRSR